jgi:hypothetical protein
MLQIPDVRRWYENLARGSPNTAETRLRRLSHFCEQNNTTPIGLIELGKSDRKALEDLLQDHISFMEKNNASPGYIDSTIKSIRSWLNHNEIEIKRRLKIANRDFTPTLQNERVPIKEELQTLLIHSDDRAKVSIVLVAMAGLRLETLGNYDASDGLVIADFPEMNIDGNKISFLNFPTQISIRRELSKTSHRYFTFLPKQGCDYLKAYLEKRIKSGETLSSDSPVIITAYGPEFRNKNSKFITTRNVSRLIREAMRPRFNWRPYVLRSYFDTQLLLAESHGKISHPYRVFFMGHKGDIEARYTTNKGILPIDLIEDMRQAYLRSEPYLCTVQQETVDKKSMLLEMWREQAKLYGIDPMKIRIEKQRKLKREPNVDEEKEALQLEIKKLTTSPMRLIEYNKFQNKLVSEDKLEDYLNNGWEMIQTINNKILVRRESRNKRVEKVD